MAWTGHLHQRRVAPRKSMFRHNDVLVLPVVLRYETMQYTIQGCTLTTRQVSNAKRLGWFDKIQKTEIVYRRDTSGVELLREQTKGCATTKKCRYEGAFKMLLLPVVTLPWLTTDLQINSPILISRLLGIPEKT